MESGITQCPAAGWLRCTAMEGHDMIDRRDQLAFDKITEKTDTVNNPNN